MKSTTNSIDGTTKTLHLVAPSSQGKPLCGEASPDAAIGSYCEHLNDQGEWCREVFGRGGIRGTACEACLALYPSPLWGRSHRVQNGLLLHTVIAVSPYPQSMREEFQLKSFCVNDEFMVEPEPSVIGQHLLDGKIALTLMVHIVPK